MRQLQSNGAKLGLNISYTRFYLLYHLSILNKAHQSNNAPPTIKKFTTSRSHHKRSKGQTTVQCDCIATGHRQGTDATSLPNKARRQSNNHLYVHYSCSHKGSQFLRHILLASIYEMEGAVGRYGKCVREHRVTTGGGRHGDLYIDVEK